MRRYLLCEVNLLELVLSLDEVDFLDAEALDESSANSRLLKFLLLLTDEAGIAT